MMSHSIGSLKEERNIIFWRPQKYRQSLLPHFDESDGGCFVSHDSEQKLLMLEREGEGGSSQKKKKKKEKVKTMDDDEEEAEEGGI
jgi:hypothetical protein